MKLEFKTENGEKYVKNPVSNRWTKVSSATGRKLIGKDVCRVYKPIPGFVPKAHQKEIASAFMNSSYRGIALVHGLGSGKTCTYASIIDAWLSNPDNPRKIIIITSGSLRENFISQYCSFCGKNKKNILDMFTFISYNYTNVLSNLPDLSNALIIIDEVHNILNSKNNESGVIAELYDRIKQSESIIVAGSGTILVSNIEELYYLMQLIKPQAFKDINDFYSQFKEDDNGIIKPVKERDLLQRLSGVIDYMKSIDESGAANDYPRVTYENVMVPIDEDEERLERIVYWRQYEMGVRRPKEIGSNPEILKAQKTKYYLATSLLHSRQTSNFLYPSSPNALKLGSKDAPSNLYKVMPDEEKKNRWPDKLISQGGWIDRKTIFDVLPEIGEKINDMLTHILENKGKHVIYTSFRTYYGEELISTLLDLINIKYITFTGDLNDAERSDRLNKYNAESNTHGEEYKVLIMTDAGAEGITLLAVRYQHILEQSITEYLIQQVMGRCNRYKSHNQLPAKERTLVIRRYFLDIEATFPDFKNDLWSPDVVAFNRGQKKQNSISYMVGKVIPKLKVR